MNNKWFSVYFDFVNIIVSVCSTYLEKIPVQIIEAIKDIALWLMGKRFVRLLEK